MLKKVMKALGYIPVEEHQDLVDELIEHVAVLNEVAKRNHRRANYWEGQAWDNAHMQAHHKRLLDEKDEQMDEILDELERTIAELEGAEKRFDDYSIHTAMIEEELAHYYEHEDTKTWQ